MTAIVTLDAELDSDEPVTITKADVDRLRGSHSRLQVGTTLTRDELLHLALMASENRAASAIASSYPGGKDSCVLAMKPESAAARHVGHALPRTAPGFPAATCRPAQDLAEARASRARLPQDPRLYDLDFVPGQDRGAARCASAIPTISPAAPRWITVCPRPGTSPRRGAVSSCR